MISSALIDQLVYDITSRFDASITPAEARALVATPDVERSFNWLLEVLSDVAIEHEKIEAIDDIDFDRFFGVGLFLAEDNLAYLFSFDELKQRVVFKHLFTEQREDWQSIQDQLRGIESPLIYRFYELRII